ncbi:MAG: GNAT family N-acetyltransferase [Leptospirales bacterium]|nr:GNAT family N-acetyltransferase [Leptospirales bacterium]
MQFSVDTTLARLDFQLIHKWLSNTYWARGMSLARIQKGFKASTVVAGAYLRSGQLIGVARCVSDTTRFGYIADVFVDPALRGKGVAQKLVKRLMEEPKVKDVEHWYLITKDAQPLYQKLGFKVFDKPERFMRFSRTKA